MKSLTIIYFCVCLVIGVNCSIDICIPLHDENLSIDDLQQKVADDLKNKIGENDVIDLGHLDLDITHEAFSVKGTMDNVLISNLSDYSIKFFIFNGTKVDLFNITFHDIYVKGIYDITGDIGQLFSIFGKGDFWINFIDFSIGMTNFNISLSTDVCFTINIDLQLQDIKNWFDNFMGDEELERLLNETIMAIAPEAMVIIWEEIKMAIDGPLEDWINDWLHHNENIQRYLLMRILSVHAFNSLT